MQIEDYLLFLCAFDSSTIFLRVILSKIIAKATIAKPLNNPKAKYWFKYSS